MSHRASFYLKAAQGLLARTPAWPVQGAPGHLQASTLPQGLPLSLGAVSLVSVVICSLQHPLSGPRPRTLWALEE
jgi:hypothetical protein